MRVSSTIIVLSLCLAGCAVGPDFERPCPPEATSYTENPLPPTTVQASQEEGGEAQTFLAERDIPACWWHLFHSENLNKVIEAGLKKNPTLKAAQASLEEAKANLNVSVASFFPFVNLQPFAERQRFNPDIFGATAFNTQTFNLFNASVAVTYTLDLFGGIRRQVESAEAQMEAQQYEVEATYLILVGNTVTAAITEASLRAQIQATESLIALFQKERDIIEKKLKSGGASQLDVLAQDSLLSTTKATLPPLQKALAQVRHGLASLVGEIPSESHLPIFNLSDFHLPAELPLSLPSALVNQRPDIREAEALLHAASAQVGVATANLLPQVTLSGGYGWNANTLDLLFSHRESTWNVLAGLLQPVFQGGALIAKRKAALAVLEQACAQYKKTVLGAFQNVADTLTALELDAKELQSQREAEDIAYKTFGLTQSQYNVGAVNEIALLDAERQVLQARISRIQAQAARYADTAALFQALGGGWWNR